MVCWCPLVRLCDYKSLIGSLVTPSSLLPCIVLWVFHILHIGDNRLRVKAVFLICFELLLIELLAFYTPRIAVFELGEICVAGIVCLGWMMRHLRKLRLFLVDVGSLELFYFFHLFLLVFREGKQEIFDTFTLLQFAAQFLTHSSNIKPEESIPSIHHQLWYQLLVSRVDFLQLTKALLIIVRDLLPELLLVNFCFVASAL